MAKKFPNLMNTSKPLIQAQRTLNKTNTKKNTSKKIKVKLLETKDKEKILKADWKLKRLSPSHTGGQQ